MATHEPRSGLGCPEVLERVYEFLDRQITPELEGEIREHLRACASCCPEYELEAAFLDAVRRQRERDRARAEFKAQVVAALRARQSGGDHGTTGVEELGGQAPASSLEFDEEATERLTSGLSQLRDRVESALRILAEHRGCEAFQGEMARLREEAGDLAAEALRVHVQTCVDRAVRAGEATAALRSLQGALTRWIG